MKNQDNELLDNYIESIFKEEIGISKVQSDFLKLWLKLGMPEIEELGLFGINEDEFLNPTNKSVKKLELCINKYNKKNNKNNK